MPDTTMTSTEFWRHIARARRAAEKGIVFVTERGRPAYVLLTAARYEELLSGLTAGRGVGRQTEAIPSSA
jgi:PHD/YefM family antitoxin component YafN of YafNO toxin-antitoxin module